MDSKVGRLGVHEDGVLGCAFSWFEGSDITAGRVGQSWRTEARFQSTFKVSLGEATVLRTSTHSTSDTSGHCRSLSKPERAVRDCLFVCLLPPTIVCEYYILEITQQQMIAAATVMELGKQSLMAKNILSSKKYIPIQTKAWSTAL